MKYYHKNLYQPEFGLPLGSGIITQTIPRGWCPYETNVAVLNEKHLQILIAALILYYMHEKLLTITVHTLLFPAILRP